MKKKKYFLKLVVAFFLGITLTLVIVYYLYTNASKNISESDKLLLTNPSLALKKLEQAKLQWPLLNYDESFEIKFKLAQKIYQSSKTEPGVILLLKSQASDSQIQSLMEELKKVKGVEKVNFVSKEDALKRYQEQNKKDPMLLKIVTIDILPASIEIYFENLTLKGELTQLIKDKTFVERIDQRPYKDLLK